MFHNSLCYFESNSGDECVSCCGVPVWPVASEGELLSLRNIAAAFDFSLSKIGRDSVSTEEKASGPGSVLAFPEHRDAAVIYAHLTSRRVQIIDTVCDISRVVDPRVVLTTFDRLDRDFYRRLEQDAKAGRVIGVIAAENLSALCLTAKQKAAAYVLSKKRRIANEPIFIDILPTTDFSKHPGMGRVIFGKNAQKQELRSALKSGAQLLRIATHSDGVDADLGGGLLLCPMKSLSTGCGTRPPRCVVAENCHRLGVSLKNIGVQADIVDPGEIKAEILLWQACQGVLTESTSTDGMWGVGRLLIANPQVFVVITTVDFVLSGPMVTEDLCTRLSQGGSINLALQDFSKDSIAEDHSLFLFGDPEFVAAEVLFNLCLSQTSVPKTLPVSEGPNCKKTTIDGDVGFIQSVAKSRYPDIQASDAGDIVAHYVARRRWARLSDDWWPRAKSVSLESFPSPCPVCGNDVRSYKIGFSSDDIRSRSLVVCGRCGPVADRPITWHGTLRRVGKNTFEIDGFENILIDRVYFILFSDDQSETKIFHWVIARSDSSSRFILDTNNLPPGPLRAGVLLIGVSWAFLSIPFRYEDSLFNGNS